MMKPRLLIYIHYLEIGGAERSLVGLLHALDPSRVDVDLLLCRHSGEFMALVPPWVRVIPEDPRYAAVERPIVSIVREGRVSIACRRLLAKRRYAAWRRRHPCPPERVDEGLFQYVARAVGPALPSLGGLGEYDLAISFLHPHNIVLDKVRARRRVCWIHTDYSTVSVDHDAELPVWDGYDAIAAVSRGVADAFAAEFPTLAPKLCVVENILSPEFIRAQAALADVSAEMAVEPGMLSILSVGRYCPAKRFDLVPRMCRRMLDAGLHFRWFIIGFGDDTAIRAEIGRCGVEDTVALLGKKDNPYPYISACDIYAQPSLYEGKSVTVREAQILCRPVAVSAFPTAAAQISDGVDGVIVPLDPDGCADGLAALARDPGLRERLSAHLAGTDYGNESETSHIYSWLSQD